MPYLCIVYDMFRDPGRAEANSNSRGSVVSQRRPSAVPLLIVILPLSLAAPPRFTFLKLSCPEFADSS
jgi:hypothetical protein